MTYFSNTFLDLQAPDDLYKHSIEMSHSIATKLIIRVRAFVQEEKEGKEALEEKVSSVSSFVGGYWVIITCLCMCICACVCAINLTQQLIVFGSLIVWSASVYAPYLSILSQTDPINLTHNTTNPLKQTFLLPIFLSFLLVPHRHYHHYCR